MSCVSAECDKMIVCLQMPEPEYLLGTDILEKYCDRKHQSKKRADNSKHIAASLSGKHQGVADAQQPEEAQARTPRQHIQAKSAKLASEASHAHVAGGSGKAKSSKLLLEQEVHHTQQPANNTMLPKTLPHSRAQGLIGAVAAALKTYRERLQYLSTAVDTNLFHRIKDVQGER